MARAGLSDVRIDDDGLRFTAVDDVLCNVGFDGRRIWSFWSLRDSVADDGDDAGAAARRVAWPERLTMHLVGVTRLTLTLGDGDVVVDEEVRFGDEDRRLTVVGRDGALLGIDMYGRLVKTFETKDEAELTPLLDALETVLDLLHDQGLAAFPAYGTLLGAVREGTFLGHDNDADVGYVSEHTHPIDVIGESHRVQRAMERQGYATSRHSGAAFKIDVPDADGSVRGLDVFGGFFSEGHLALLGEIWAPYEREWIFPLGTVTLDGRVLPAPADPERLLVETYGPGWRVPDPAFRYEKDPAVQRRFDEWFRGTRLHRAAWDHRYGLARLLPPYQPPHDISRVLHEREDPDAWVLDVGCGRGRDGRWLAKQGRACVGLDYSGVAMQFVAAKAAANDWPLELRTMNLLELRHVLAWGAKLAARSGPRTVLARHVIDSTSPYGVDNFWRLVSMVLRPGERVHLEFLTEEIVDDDGRPPLVVPLLVEDVVADVERRGGRVTGRTDLVGQPIDYGYGEELSQGKQWRSCRLEVEWQ
ncbi:class I SAM-dependent methyltransferase [Nocardioides piscis]|uniref:Class I SAM-dependent methyltransferase n=1 Tax=Nocardioides piscis TaxID=2714938 RepID=A0A6G7YFX4_9ACTN|nr:class I SAM-dependent methyltransferase [Nocardioides piscis]QIK75629.1 class I SAM-dependent methyltransferase [Nocardioides piscis]